MTVRFRLFQTDHVTPIERGNGVLSTPFLQGDENVGFISGLTELPPGTEVPLHSHNVGEQVTVLSGSAYVEVDGEQRILVPFDTTYVPAGVNHRFCNRGSVALRILWVYGGTSVTRTFASDGTTVSHLSSRDRV